MRHISISLFLWMAATATAADPLPYSLQCVLVLAPNWNSTTGLLRTFERASVDSEWKIHGGVIPVVLGKKGLAWGRGLFGTNDGPGPRKIEGDNRVPAGIFRLGSAFGYAPARRAGWIKLPYVPLTAEIEGIDDPRSRYYNRLVDRSKVARVDWRTSEKMLRTDALYKWGFIVAHNPTATPGAGSCIFFHIWKSSSTATTGCTAMAEQDLVGLLRLLDPAARPVLVQMPRGDYGTFQANYRLPVTLDQPVH